jgi:hypothetical protein
LPAGELAARGEHWFRDVHAVPDPGRARREALALAFFVLVVIVGGAFAAGYLIGRILL